MPGDSLLLGVLVVIVWKLAANSGETPFPRDRAWLFLAVPLLATPWMPPSIRLGLIFLALTGVSLIWNTLWLRGFGTQMLRLSLVWMGAIGALELFGFLQPRLGAIIFPGGAVSGMLKLTGLPAQFAGSGFDLVSNGEASRVLLSSDKFGGAFAVALVGAVVGEYLLRGRWVGLAKALTLTLAYIATRGIWLAVSIGTNGSKFYWLDEKFLFLTFAPLAILLPLIAIKPSASPEGSVTGRGNFLGLVSSTLGLALIVFAWLFVDPGHPKAGKVVIDEHYSRWEWSEDPLSTERYGVKTVYSYSDWAKEMGRSKKVEQNFEEITDKTLENVSVLILKTPTKPYSQDTIQAIDRFVRRGGGLWLIGDHTDIFGMDTYLNSVGSQYGLTLESNAVIDPYTTRQIIRPRPYSHPVVREMGNFLMYTGCSIKPSWTSVDAYSADQAFIDDPDFSSNTFFGNFQLDPSESVGPVVQAAVVNVDKGRVAIWSDSTLFSNFSIYMPGKLELTHGYLNWLDRENSYSSWRWILGALGLGVLLVGLSRQPRGIAFFAIAGWTGIALGLVGSTFWVSKIYPDLKPDPEQRLAFVPSADQRCLPVLYPPVDKRDLASYLTTVVGAQRINKRPRVVSSIEEAIASPAAVILRPMSEWQQPEVDKAIQWLKGGGKLTILDGRLIPKTVHALSQEISFINLPQPKSEEENGIPVLLEDNSKMVTTTQGVRLGSQPLQTHILGGSALLRSDGKTVGAQVKVGQGDMIVTSTDFLFSDLSLGTNSEVPDLRQRDVLNVLYGWFTR